MALPLLLVVLIGFLLPGRVEANAGIPGPIIWAMIPFVKNGVVWIVATMAMCITIEGTVYHRLRLFHRPFLASAYANVWSLLAGIPLGLVGAFDPTMVVSPTILSVVVEWLVLRRYQRIHPAPDRGQTSPLRPIFWPVVLSNVATNAIMFGYLYLVAGRRI